jgi:hypothetical protein
MAESLQFVGSKDEAHKTTKPEAVEVIAYASRSVAHSTQGDITSCPETELHDNIDPSRSDCQNRSPCQPNDPLQSENRVEDSDPISVPGTSEHQRTSGHTWSTIGRSAETNSRSTRLPVIDSRTSSENGNTIPTEAVLSMLRTYRYQVAPWVSGVKYQFMSIADRC